jgi:drug/metabolite transporter (DMT)-like permease
MAALSMNGMPVAVAPVIAPPVTGVRSGVVTGIAAMACVGSSVAVSGALVGAPALTAQAMRYVLAALLLLGVTQVTGRRLVRPRGRQWGWLLGTAVTGLALFNVALVRGSAHAEPAVLGVAVACVPLLLAVLGPLMGGRPPQVHVVAAAGLVTAGVMLVAGGGRADPAGLWWALVVLFCEAAFTLLALPVLDQLGAWSVSVYAAGLAALLLGALGAIREGPEALVTLSAREWLAIAYIAVVVTAGGFVLWYVSVSSLGAARAGLLSGVAPVAAAGTGVLLGQPVPAATVWLGVAVVAAGLATGLRSADRTKQHLPPTTGSPA